jgi:hypothetical protein
MDDDRSPVGVVRFGGVIDTSVTRKVRGPVT